MDTLHAEKGASFAEKYDIQYRIPEVENGRSMNADF